MYLMYVDESGDPGISKYGSKHYILSGLIIAQNDWTKYLGRLKTFRRHIKEKYGLNQRTEIHASELIRIDKIKEYRKIKKYNRIKLLEEYATQIPLIFDSAKIINVCFDKTNFKPDEDFQTKAWNRLIQRYDNFLKKNAAPDLGIIVSDDVKDPKVLQVLRKMRVYNPISSMYNDGYYEQVTDGIIEDIFHRSSHQSYFIQSVDVVVHLLYRKEFPKGSLKKHRVETFFNNVEPILLKKASRNDPLGIVRK